jgi:hypothetical protein
MILKLCNHHFFLILFIYLFSIPEINVRVNYQLMGFLDEFLGSFVSFPSLVSNIYDIAVEKISQLK